MSNSSKKTKKALKPFAKDINMRDRLQHYINHTLDSSVMISPSGEEIVPIDRGSRRSKKRNSSENLCLKGNVCREDEYFESYDSDNLKSENFANKCLRDVYLKFNNSPQKPVMISESTHLSDCSAPKPGNVVEHINGTPKCTKSDLERRIISVLNSTEQRENNAKVLKQASLPRGAKFAKDNPNMVPKHSEVKFSDVGGMKKELEELGKVLLFLKYPENVKDFGEVTPYRGILLLGPSGCGKTLLAHAVAGELDLPLIKAQPGDLVSGISGESEGKMRQLFESAISASPCILFIDQIDEILTKTDKAQKEMQKRIVSQFIACMDELSMCDSSVNVLVIGATSQPNLLDPRVKRAGRFEKEINIGIPNENDRCEIFKILSKGLNFSDEFDINWLARNTPGYFGSDFILLIKEAFVKAYVRIHGIYTENPVTQCDCLRVDSSDTLRTEASVENVNVRKNNFFIKRDFEEALSAYVPATKKEGFATVSDVTWSDVGALKDIQKELQKAILWPIKYKKKFENFGISADAGILLCGPKGCGKTLLAKAIANECSINFLSVKGPELLNMYVGESEHAVRECFQKAKSAAPCVIFFDEIDALCPSRSYSNDNGASDRVVAQLLTEMDGIGDRKEIFVIGATNRPNHIDSALLRPRRFGKVIYVGVPSPADRCDILRTLTRKQPTLGADVCLDTLGQDARCSRFSGADLFNLVREASLIAVEDSIMLNTEEEVRMTHFEQAFNSVKPSITKNDANIFKRMKYEIENGVTLKKRRTCAATPQ